MSTTLSHYGQPDGNGLPPEGPNHNFVLSGELNSDDGKRIDDLFYPNPDLEGIPYTVTNPQQTLISPSIPSRILSATVVMSADYGSNMLMPADKNRKQLIVTFADITAPTTNQIVYWASDKNTCDSSNVKFNTITDPLNLIGYTGAFWVRSDSANSNSVVVSVWAVTE
jgi:hypothetical protein